MNKTLTGLFMAQSFQIWVLQRERVRDFKNTQGELSVFSTEGKIRTLKS